MRRPGKALGWAATGALVLAACFSDRDGGLTALPADCQTLATNAGISASDVVVGIIDFTFVPALVTVPRGATVTWINCESTIGLAHTATADGGGFGSPLFTPGETFSQTFATAGNNPYHCEPHPFMQGQVVVE